MELMVNYEDHIKWLSERIDEGPTSTMVTSFGLYAGISYAGEDMTKIGWKFRSKTRDLMEKMRNLPNVRFLIGVPKYRSCKGKSQCINCEAQYTKDIIRLSNHIQFFPEFKWRMTSDLHLKSCIFTYGKTCKGISGGRNFTDSDWFDCTFELSKEHVRKLLEHVAEVWGNSKRLDDDTLGDILLDQGISEEGFNSVIREPVRLIEGKESESIKEEAPF